MTTETQIEKEIEEIKQTLKEIKAELHSLTVRLATGLPINDPRIRFARTPLVSRLDQPLD
jgi:ribosomal protein L29